jgi:hypothetical protein
MDLKVMERIGDRWEKMEGSCSTGQSPPWAVVPVEEEEEEEEEEYCDLLLCRATGALAKVVQVETCSDFLSSVTCT